MAGKVLAVASIKGGVGKSTLVACLASHWLKAGRTVGLLDTDPNRTLSRWHTLEGSIRKAVLITELDEHQILPQIAQLQRANDVTLVDCAGFGNQAMIFAIGGADLVVIPVMTDEASIYEAMRTRRLVESAATMARREIPVRTLLTRVKRSRVAQHARSQLESLGAEPLSVQLADRSAFQEASFFGSAPTTTAPSSAAAQEIRATADAIATALGWPHHEARSGVTPEQRVR